MTQDENVDDLLTDKEMEMFLLLLSIAVKNYHNGEWESITGDDLGVSDIVRYLKMSLSFEIADTELERACYLYHKERDDG